jgi:hypothetical protein
MDTMSYLGAIRRARGPRRPPAPDQPRDQRASGRKAATQRSQLGGDDVALGIVEHPDRYQREAGKAGIEA